MSSTDRNEPSQSTLARHLPPADSAREHRQVEGLRAAVELLRIEGWESVTQTKVAAQSGLSREVVDEIWPDRNALVRDAIRAVSLDAAIDLLTTEGWDAVTQARVAERSKLGRATIYRYWPQREKLVHDAVVAHMTIPARADPVGDLAKDLLTELDLLTSELVDRSLRTVIAALIDRAEWQPDLREWKQDVNQLGIGNLRVLLVAGLERGELRPGSDVDALVSMLIGPVLFRNMISGEPIGHDFNKWLIRTMLDAHGAN